MCGIAGIVSHATGVIEPRERLNSALQLMASRGPDARGVFSADHAYLGHVRLSIIDVSDAARQPMRSQCGRYVIVFNGEIYNYKEIKSELSASIVWRTSSDTEVILEAYKAWGERCFQRFVGMFAIALYDLALDKLLLVRDRLGVKPLYYCNDGSCLGFASRPRSLLALMGRAATPSRQALRYYLEAGYIPSPHAAINGVAKLNPGEILVCEGGKSTTYSYWGLEKATTSFDLKQASEHSLLEQLDFLISSSVNLRLVSDVPVGAFLSGGIDSSLVAAIMARNSGSALRTFTIGFADQQFDESRHAEAVARYLGADHTCEILSADDLLSLMPTFIEQYDEPFYDYSAFPVMAVARLASRSVKVCLSGDGGDEAFGGYHYYRIAEALGRVRRLTPAGIRKVIARGLSACPGKLGLLGHAMRRDDGPSAFAFSRSVIKDSGGIIADSLLNDTKSLEDLFCERASGFASELSPAEEAMRLDTAYTLPDDYLQKVDVGTMAFSIEARDPLLDHRIFEWAARLPLEWKIRGKTNKYLLRKLAYKYLPQNLIDRPKMGFGVPMARWLRGPLRHWGEDLLGDTGALRDLELKEGEVRRLWALHQSGARDVHTALWAVLVLVQYYRSHVGKIA